MRVTTAIIGGGAAGIAAAITAAQHGQRVLVLERNRKPLKKLGVTGNGRANLLNSDEPVYYGATAFALEVLKQTGYPALCDFFASLGVPLREETEGRVYPAALQAAVVTEALLLRAAQLEVQFSYSTRVTALTREGDGFLLHALQTQDDSDPRKSGKPSANGSKQPQPQTLCLRAERVIITVGGAAAPAHGTDGSGYGLLTGFGHRLTPLRPALCALLTDKRRVVGLSGQRIRADLTLLSRDGRTLHTAGGEALFGDDAVSGIAAMQLARFVEEGASLSLDLRPAAGWTQSSALPGQAASRSVFSRLQFLSRLRAERPLADLLTGVFTAPIARLVCREANLGEPGMPISRLRETDLRRLAATIADLRLPITGTRGFDQAQVTAGGIVTDDFHPATLESRLCPGLYAAGEVLDVDGDCGGFNLMFAFASGILAGRAAGG